MLDRGSGSGGVQVQEEFRFRRGLGSGGGLVFLQAAVTCATVGFEPDFDLFNKRVK